MNMSEYDTHYVHNNQKMLKTDNLRIKYNLKNILHSLDFCGICLVKGVNIVSMDDILPNEEDMTLKEMVKEAFGEQLLDNITNYYACGNCKLQILEAYRFVFKIKSSSVVLNHYMEQIETHLETVEEMLHRTEKCDFENTVVVLHDFITSDEIKSDSDGQNSDHFNSYVCEHCNKTFKTRYLITKHLVNTHNMVLSNSNLLCSECMEYPCPHEKYLEAVKIQLDLGAKLFNCIDCGYEAQTKGSMIAHINKEHLKLQPYLKSSSQTFDSRKFRFPTMFFCDLCSKKCKSEAFLVRHKYNTHGIKKHSKDKRKKLEKDSTQWVCSSCPLALTSLAEMREHQNTHRSSEKYKCTICNKEFETRRLLNLHVSTVAHSRKNDPKVQFDFRCSFPDCDFSAKTKIAVENHKNTSHLKIKPYACGLCNKKFTASVSLKYHMERHEGVKRFQCSVCCTYFTSAYGLKKHNLRHHSENRPIKCDLCPQSFVCPSEYDLHYSRSHSAKSISCPLCESKFRCTANLRGHIRKVHFQGKRFNEILATKKVSKEIYEIFRDRRLAF